MRDNTLNKKQDFHLICGLMDAVRVSIDISVLGGLVTTACQLHAHHTNKNYLLKIPAYLELSYAYLVLGLLVRKLFTDYQGARRQGFCLAALDYRTIFRVSTAFLSIFSGLAILNGLEGSEPTDHYWVEVGLIVTAMSISVSQQISSLLPENSIPIALEDDEINQHDDGSDQTVLGAERAHEFVFIYVLFTFLCTCFSSLQLPLVLLGGYVLTMAGHDSYRPFFALEGLKIGGLSSFITVNMAVFSMLLPTLSMTDCLRFQSIAEMDVEQRRYFSNIPMCGFFISSATALVSPAIAACLLQSDPSQAMAAFYVGTGIVSAVGWCTGLSVTAVNHYCYR